MSKELAKKAIDMLLNGATLVGEPCPYCKGVRVMKNGYALCPITILEKKLETLSKDIEVEKDLEKQKEILKSINLLVEIIGKLKK